MPEKADDEVSSNMQKNLATKFANFGIFSSDDVPVPILRRSKTQLRVRKSRFGLKSLYKTDQKGEVPKSF